MQDLMFTNIIFILSALAVTAAAVSAVIKLVKIILRPDDAEDIISSTPDFFECIFFGYIGLASIIYRLTALPNDGGGYFIHVLFTLVGFGAFAALSTQTRGVRLIGRATLLPAGFCLLFSTTYLSVWAFAPVIIVVVSVSLIPILVIRKKFLAVILPLVLAFFLLNPACASIKHVSEIYGFRHIDPGTVTQIHFMPVDDNKQETVTITAKEQITPLIKALSKTFPYAPNHETIPSPWYRVTVSLENGEEVMFRLGRGNSEYPFTSWLEFGSSQSLGGVYQNKSFYYALRKLNLPLWKGVKITYVRPGDPGALLLICFTLSFIFLLSLSGMTAHHWRQLRDGFKRSWKKTGKSPVDDLSFDPYKRKPRGSKEGGKKIE